MFLALFAVFRWSHICHTASANFFPVKQSTVGCFFGFLSVKSVRCRKPFKHNFSIIFEIALWLFFIHFSTSSIDFLTIFWRLILCILWHVRSLQLYARISDILNASILFSWECSSDCVKSWCYLVVVIDFISVADMSIRQWVHLWIFFCSSKLWLIFLPAILATNRM